MPISDLTQSYIDFLPHLENIGGNRDLTALKKIYGSLENVFKGFSSIQSRVPETLEHEMVQIRLQIGTLAMYAGEWKAALASFEFAKQFGAQNLDPYITYIKDQLRT
jgi:outer membrane protein assembly factor BamD (BamD/ComL family)